MYVVGHRGARNEAPENTVEGFIHAFENGCRHFELDIQLSADGELVVYHDAGLSRTSGQPGKIKHHTAAELRTFDSRYNTPGWHAPCYIPHLEEVLEAVPKTLSWQLEVKSDHRHSLKLIIRKLHALYVNYELFDHAVVTSSNRWLLAELKRVAPQIKTGYVAEYRYRRPLRTALALQCDMLVINNRLISRPLVDRAHKHNIEVSCWTVNDIERIKFLQEIGADSVITDIPTAALASMAKTEEPISA